jgi:hypothetical protein
MKARSLIQTGMECLPPKGYENDLTNLVLELLANDLQELFENLSSKLKWLIKEDEVGDIFQDWKKEETLSVLKHLKTSFNDL